MKVTGRLLDWCLLALTRVHRGAYIKVVFNGNWVGTSQNWRLQTCGAYMKVALRTGLTVHVSFETCLVQMNI